MHETRSTPEPLRSPKNPKRGPAPAGDYPPLRIPLLIILTWNPPSRTPAHIRSRNPEFANRPLPTPRGNVRPQSCTPTGEPTCRQPAPGPRPPRHPVSPMSIAAAPSNSASRTPKTLTKHGLRRPASSRTVPTALADFPAISRPQRALQTGTNRTFGNGPSTPPRKRHSGSGTPSSDGRRFIPF